MPRGCRRGGLRGSWGDAHGWSLGSELRSKPIRGARGRARHNSIQASFVPVRYHRERSGLPASLGGRHRQAQEPDVALPVVRVHDQGGLRQAAGVLVVAAPGPGRVALGGSGGTAQVAVPQPWGPYPGGAVRPAGFAVHPRLRGPGRLVGDHDGQDRAAPAGAGRLGHHRADHRAGDADRPGSQSAG